MAYLDDVYAVVQIQPTGVETFVRLSQNENGRQLYFAIQGGELPSGSTATISGTKPDGVVYSASAAVSGNVVTVNEDIQMTAAAGAWSAKLRILNGGQVIATGRIRFVIDADPVAPGSVPSDSELEGLVAEAAEYAEAAKNAAYYGSPLVASTVAGMTDHTRVYVYTGSESGYTNGNWYYWNGSAWTSGGVYNAQGISTDPTLTISGKAADSKATGDRLTAAENDISDVKSDLVDMQEEIEEFSGGLTPEIKVALLNCFEKVGWIDDNGQSYYDALEAALYADNIDHIEAVLSLGTHQVIMGDDLDSLRDYLTVTVYYKDETQEVVTNYGLSGDISTEGTKTITVTLGRRSTTFTCSVEWGYRLTAESGEIAVGGIVFNPLSSSIGTYFEPTNTIRYSNKTFLPWETGYDCYVDADTALNVVVSVNAFNQIAMTSVANNQNITDANVGRPGWQTSNPSLSVIPNSVNNSPVKTIRVTFKTVPTESAFSANSISEVRITRRAK